MNRANYHCPPQVLPDWSKYYRIIPGMLGHRLGFQLLLYRDDHVRSIVGRSIVSSGTPLSGKIQYDIKEPINDETPKNLPIFASPNPASSLNTN